MNRRNFFKSLAIAAASVAILPSALTYKRTWAKTADSGVWIVNPEWINAAYEIQFYNFAIFNSNPFLNNLEGGAFPSVPVLRYSEL